LQGDRDGCGQLRREYDSLLREKGECRRVLEDLMRENELKSKECHEAQTSLHELQMELMRKSMHVGSLGKNLSVCQANLHCSSLLTIAAEK
jgi:kinesin family protein C2/C3